MSVAPNQLGEIYREIRESFLSHPVISIKPAKGDPPDHYEIIYNLKGMSKTSTGEIVVSIGHTVELAIPFGFPHFPPSCKPKSDIFHPDFDPGAICLGDFWNQDQALTELIIRIGKMINGEIYSTANAFNEEAATWYLENSNKMPLAHLDWGTKVETDFNFDDNVREIDTLDDADLTSDFNWPPLTGIDPEEDITLNTSFSETDEAPEIDYEFLHLLESQKKFYTLLETTINTASSSEEISRLIQVARVEIKQAKQLHQEGKNFENQGNAKNSLERYQQVANAVIDFPTIDSDIKRITQTLALLEDMALDSFDQTDDAAAVHDNLAQAPPAKTRKSSLQTRKNAFPDGGVKSKAPLYLILGMLVSIVGCSGYFWYSFNHNLGKAEETFSFCTEALENNQFDRTKLSCEKALQSLKKAKFIQQDRVKELQNSIGEILQSEKFTQGLAGKILFEGTYLPKNEVQIMQSLKALQSDAEAFYQDEKWQPALESYQKILNQSDKTGYLPLEVLEDINHKSLISEFRLFYDSAQIPMQRGQWQEAAEKLIKAQSILKTMPEKDREQYFDQLQYAIQKCRFEDFKTQGDLFFSKADWKNAISGYNLALSSAEEKASLTPKLVDTVKKNIKRAELYESINKGNEAFSSGAWDKAIEAYNEASIFLAQNQDILSQKDAESNQLKLVRITLQTSIIRDRQTAKTQLDDKDLAGARKSYLQLLDHIAKSPLASEEELITIRDEITSALESLDEEIFLTEKREYLKSNYKSLFIDVYSTYTPENLSNPSIVFTKEIDSRLIFRMQCTEKTRGGRPSTLRIYYAFDQKTGNWSRYSENQ